MLVVGDIGSTFTKMLALTEEGEPLAAARVPTSREDLLAGVEGARERVFAALGSREEEAELILCSSAAGGLRVAVLGLEPELTLAAGLRTGATAGARIVAAIGAEELRRTGAAAITAGEPDIVLLTGGTDGGDAEAIVAHAEALRAAAPEVPVVVAGNRSARERVLAALGPDRLVRCADNVMPRVGEVSPGSAREELRALFIDHVIGHGRFASAAGLAAAIRMPTPSAVLAATAAIARRHGSALAARPVVVDVGGATTDVHSALPVEPGSAGLAPSGLADSHLTRTVEGDLGMRENAPAIVAEATRAGHDAGQVEALAGPAERRAAERSFIAADPAEQRADARLAAIASGAALLRHAGTMRTIVTAEGALLKKDGRDLRAASCVVATGGALAAAGRGAGIVREGLEWARSRSGLVPAEVPVRVDEDYLLWAVGLLAGSHPPAADGLLDRAFGGEL